MSTPQGTPVKHVRLGLASAKSSPLTNEFKRLLCDQHQRLSLKHQQDLDLIDDIRSYVKARLSIEKDYTNALQKLAKHHSNHIQKKFQLLHQLDRDQLDQSNAGAGNAGNSNQPASGLDGGNKPANVGSSSMRGNANGLGGNETQDQKTKHQHNQSENQQPTRPSSLYKVWCDHVNCLQSTARNRADQFEQSNLIVDKLKDIRQHKASIGKKCLDTHLRRIQEDVLASMLDVDKAKKLYYEDESQAKKARENEERIKKKRSGLLTKFTDLQAKKERSSAQREATDIQSTQARNDYIMALAAANSHLNYYYYRDLKDFIHLIDDGVLDHCKIFMATLSECDINSLKDSLSHAQYWSRLINLTGSQQTNQIFLDCEQSKCLKDKQELQFEACNNDPIHKISLEHNADYALQHEIDKWFTWFKKECRNLSQLMHQLDTCQQAFADGKKGIELNGQTVDDLEPKIIDLKQQIRKCEAAKLRAQARLMVIKEGGMQIEEWSAVELEIRADMARAQEEQERAKRSRDMMDEGNQDGRTTGVSFDEPGVSTGSGGPNDPAGGLAASSSIHLQVSRDSDDSDTQVDESMHMASVSRSTSNLVQKQQQALSGYSALTDPSLVWQDDYSAAWGAGSTTGVAAPSAQEASAALQDSADQAQEQPLTTIKSPTSPRPADFDTNDGLSREASGYDLLRTTQNDPQQAQKQQQQHIPNASMSIQSSSPLSAIVNGGQHLSQSPYQGAMSEAYKSDYECDYTRIGQHSVRSAASSVEPASQQQATKQQDEFGAELDSVGKMLNRQVIALYKFEKNNHDDLEFDEHDLLEVIEVNAEDTNWVKARHLLNGKEGYIPSSYVRLYEGSDELQGQQRRQSSAWSASGDQNDRQRQMADQTFDNVAANDDDDDGLGGETGPSYCRALYDYTPDGDAVDEEDGLPHLSLAQGELCKIIDQGEDDGWWLVEKQETGIRGHVPSMLVEEVEPGEEANEMADDDDDGDVTDEFEQDVDDDEHPFQEPPPSFEAPRLALDDDEEPPPETTTGGGYSTEKAAAVWGESAETQLETSTETGDTSYAGQGEPPGQTSSMQQTTLIPKSFIIIEPTPEVESRRFEDDLGQGEQAPPDDDAKGAGGDEDSRANTQTRQVVQSQPPSATGQMGYSVYNEDFVLEKPTRKGNAAHVADPLHHHHSSPSSSHSHEPTIIEEDDSAVANNQAEQAPASADDNQRSLSECDDEQFQFDNRNMPPPPSVVIDSVEAIPRSPDLSFDEDHADGDQQDDRQSQYSDLSQDGDPHETASNSSSERKPVRHTNYADVNPILRHHADEFTKQLIEEAIMLAPGSRIGPSTSSADMQNDGDSDEEEGQSENANDDARPAFENEPARSNHVLSNGTFNHRGHNGGDDDDEDDDDI